MQSVDYFPGIPAAGHITPSGFWHHGSAANCSQCNERPKR